MQKKISHLVEQQEDIKFIEDTVELIKDHSSKVFIQYPSGKTCFRIVRMIH